MGISWQQLLIILIIVALIFGTKKLRNIGSDLGGAVKGFKESMNDSKAEDAEEPEAEQPQQQAHNQESVADNKSDDSETKS